MSGLCSATRRTANMRSCLRYETDQHANSQQETIVFCTQTQMNTVCTSCGLQIPSSLNFCKCRQCVNHFVWQSCDSKGHNRSSTAFHTLEIVLAANVQPKTVAHSALPKGAEPQQSQAAVSLITAINHLLLILILDCRHLQSLHRYLRVKGIYTAY